MKRIKKILLATGLICVLSCTSYLDVVPDNILTLDNVFTNRENALSALAKVYSYIPSVASTHNTEWSLGDEWIGRLDLTTNRNDLQAIKIMEGMQSATSPLLNYWGAGNSVSKLYEGIRQANVFMANIHKTIDMLDDEKAEWTAQVKFLKAYYMFLLIQKYGPIVIPDEVVMPDATLEQLFLPRQKLETCFDNVITLIDEAIPALRERASRDNYGQIDRTIAKAMKAKILFFRASPFYNGNKEYFGDFLDSDGEPFFPQVYNKEKWKDAIDAINDAITACTNNGIELYTYEKIPFLYDTEDFDANKEKMQLLYNLRMLVVDPWNKELIWGFSNLSGGDGELAYGSAIRIPSGYAGQEGGTGYNWQWMGATYQMLERYYTKNGLPITEDATFDMSNIHELTKTPDADSAEYRDMRGILQPNSDIINLYLNREMRFYANLGITGGYWRSFTFRLPTLMYADLPYPYAGGKTSISSTDFLCTGVGVQKFVHPESKAYHGARVIKYPYPVIRMADLYLMKAEALNEYKDNPDAEVYEAINIVRRRAGIPDVQTVWADAMLTKHPGYHTTKEGMRDIILHERSIELAFEGSHFWDMLRHKKAPAEFSAPIWGWNHEGSSGQTFFTLMPKQSRKFQIKDCLWPIPLDEMNTNSRLIQNPGW
jgi:hypothetical protein